jgi:phosphatidylglycerol:prolipoprotein diacylglycerol transferase
MVATGLLSASYILNADFRRRGIRADAFLVIGIAGLAGIVGARFYHLLESPSEFFADPWPLLISRFGFAWFGGFLGGFVALFLIARGTLSRLFARLKCKELALSLELGRVTVLEFLDTCSPAAAAGYAIGRIGCFLSGDGDYGIPTSLPWGLSFPNGVVPTSERVHPTPLYEFLAWMLIAYVLWRIGTRALRQKNSAGLVFCAYLVLTGISRFLVEIIRLNPRSFLGMSNAQAASLASVLLGLALYFFLVRKSSGTATSPTTS